MSKVEQTFEDFKNQFTTELDRKYTVDNLAFRSYPDESSPNLLGYISVTADSSPLFVSIILVDGKPVMYVGDVPYEWSLKGFDKLTEDFIDMLIEEEDEDDEDED